MVAVLLDDSPLYFRSQGLSLKPELTKQAAGTYVSTSLTLRFPAYSTPLNFHVGSRGVKVRSLGLCGKHQNY